MSERVRAAIVTGAGSGIGREVAKLLHGAGWSLALVGRREGPLAETREALSAASGPEVVVLPADVGVIAEAEGIVKRAAEALGGLSALVNNAGLAPLKPVAEIGAAEAEAVFRVNALGPIGTIRAALPRFVGQGYGTIVTVTSRAAFDPFTGLTVYGAAKAAMQTLTKGIATEYGEKGVRAFAVAPGAVETGMLRAIISEEMLPREQTMSPAYVAGVVVACVTGAAEVENGGVVEVFE